jgi:hypothetical protein
MEADAVLADSDSETDGDNGDNRDDNAEKSQAMKPKPDGLLPPFSWTAFQAFTGLSRSVFSPTVNMYTPKNWQTKDDNDAVWAFVTTFWSYSEAEQISFIPRNLKDQHSRGQILYLDWAKTELKRFSFTETAREIMSDLGADPFSTSSVPAPAATTLRRSNRVAEKALKVSEPFPPRRGSGGACGKSP